MKKLGSLIVLSLLLFTASWVAWGNSVNDDAMHILNRTVKVVNQAQNAAKSINIYKGLALCVTHQRQAQDFYKAGRFEEAIYHSLRSRELAITVITSNRYFLDKKYQTLDEIEAGYDARKPASKDLDAAVKKRIVGMDKDAVNYGVSMVKASTAPAIPAPATQKPAPAAVAAVPGPAALPAPAPKAPPAAGIKGVVAYAEEGMVIINLGVNDGVREGMVFVVSHIKAVVQDPNTGKVIDEVMVPTAELRVNEVKEMASTCTVMNTLNPNFPIAVKDPVKLKP